MRAGTNAVGASTLTLPKLRLDADGREQRVVVSRAQLRAGNPEDGGPIPFTGHAAVFNSRSQVLADYWDVFQEQLEPGAFRNVLDHDVRFLINHDPSLVAARTLAGNLRLSEDDVGLLTEAELVPTGPVRDMAALMRAGVVTQMSFSFAVSPDGERWEMGPDGMLLRTITDVLELYDVSAVTYPAYLETDAALRAAGRSRVQAAESQQREAAKADFALRRDQQAMRHRAIAARFGVAG